MKKLFNVPYVLNVELAEQALNPDNRLVEAPNYLMKR